MPKSVNYLVIALFSLCGAAHAKEVSIPKNATYCKIVTGQTYNYAEEKMEPCDYIFDCDGNVIRDEELVDRCISNHGLSYWIKKFNENGYKLLSCNAFSDLKSPIDTCYFTK